MGNMNEKLAGRMSRKRGKLSPEDVRDALQPGERLTITQLLARIRINRSTLYELCMLACKQKLMARAYDDGAIDTGKRAILYWRCDGDLSLVGKPYPQILFGPDVPDASAQIGADLFSHMRRCRP